MLQAYWRDERVVYRKRISERDNAGNVSTSLDADAVEAGAQVCEAADGPTYLFYSENQRPSSTEPCDEDVQQVMTTFRLSHEDATRALIVKQELGTKCSF
jgi:hypothetical protein